MKMDLLHLAQITVALASTGWSAWTDRTTGLIPNRITGTACLVGLLLTGARGGADGLILGLAGGFVAALVPLILFKCGAMGGGDVKLFAALGVLLGPAGALETQFVAFAIGAAEGAFVWFRNGQLMRGLAASAQLVIRPTGLLKSASAGSALTCKTEIRLGPAIFVATVLVVAYRWAQ
jgi:prepilin peptidase CpaA